MNPSSKSKSKDKKPVNDLQKTPIKASSGSMSANTGLVSGAYNPLLGTFQSIESLSTTGSAALHNNGRFRNIDESDSTGADCDSVSNNGSWSGESEDQKEKVSNPPARQEIIPGADNDKREKTRLKNERKHQRQKEKRAQELHERCRQYLMSRKLEVLSQQLVAMGISQDRATLALMLNEGKVEESISWLFDQDGAKVAEQQMDSAAGNLKMDMSEEFGRLLELETRYKCTKQEVERAVVSAEGDIKKAEETLKRQKQEQSTTNSRPEETSDIFSPSSYKLTTQCASQSTVAQLQQKANLCPAGQEIRDRKDIEYSRGSSFGGVSESLNQNHSLDRIQMKLEWMKLQNAVMGEKTWSGMGSNTPMLNHQPLAGPPKPETHYVALGNQLKNLQQQDIRDPVMAMQQCSGSANTYLVPTMDSSFSGTANGWFPSNRTEVTQSNGFVPNIAATRSFTPNDLNSNPTYQQLQCHHYQGQMNSHRSGATAARAVAAASLGLFSGYGSAPTSGSSPSSLDWNTSGLMGQLDYANIDWSLDRSLSCPRPNRQFLSSAIPSYNPNINGSNDRPGMRITVNGYGMGITGMQEVGVGSMADIPRTNARDWTSPFEGKDLFSLSRQFVSSTR